MQEKKKSCGKVIQIWIKEACIFKWLKQLLNRVSRDWVNAWYGMIMSDSWPNALKMDS